MFEEFWKIDKSMGESRWDQILGLVVILALVVFVIYNKEITKLVKEIMQWV